MYEKTGYVSTYIKRSFPCTMCGHWTPTIFDHTHATCSPVAFYKILQVLQSALFAMTHDEERAIIPLLFKRISNDVIVSQQHFFFYKDYYAMQEPLDSIVPSDGPAPRKKPRIKSTNNQPQLQCICSWDDCNGIHLALKNKLWLCCSVYVVCG
jgi:hypothetical protein